MPDIDTIISGYGGNTRADFSGLSNLPDAYRKGADFAYQQKMQNLYSDKNGGLPRDKDGNVDTSKMYERLIQAGGAPAIESADKLVNSGLTQARIRFAPQAGETLSNADQPPAAAPQGFPPSANRSAPAKVVPPLPRGGVVPPQDGQAAPPAQSSPQGDRPGSLMSFLSNWGVPDELAGSEMNILCGKLSQALGRRVDPNQPMDMNDPKIRGILGDWVRSRDSRNGAPGAAPAAPGQDGAPNFSARFAGGPSGQPQQPQAAPQSYGGPVQAGPAGPQPVQQMQPQGQPGQPAATPSAPVAGDDAQTLNLRRAAGTLEKVLASGRLLPEAAKAYEAKLQSIYKQLEPTNEMKNFRQSQADPRFDERAVENAKTDAAAKEEGSIRAKQYQSITEAGIKGQQEIPQLEMLKEQMNDPNFFSGVGEKYSYLYKQLKSAMGIDPNAAVPQEFLRKALANNVVSQLAAFKGLGQIRVAEIKLTQQATVAPDTSIPANKLLAEMALRTHQRNAVIADQAQTYVEKNGILDAGFDRQVINYEKAHPMFSKVEIADWTKAIGESKTSSAKPTAPSSAAPQQFSSQTDPRRMGVTSGQIIMDENGRKFRVR